MKTICHCDYCVKHNTRYHKYTPQTHKQIQDEFEATCFMYETIESNLKQAVDKFNGGFKLTDVQKQILAKAIWRN